MKRLIKPFKLLVPLVLMLQANLFAQENDNDNRNENKKKYEFVKKKSVNKSYNVSSSDKLNIKNAFGSVKVNTWNRNEIKVDVDIEVTANTEALAQKMIDRISVTDARSGKDISFETETKDVNNSKGEKSSMEINYTISMPENNPLKVQNDFGGITIPDFKGEVDLTSKFGSLKAGNLASIKSIHIEFGEANLVNINSAPVTIKFSKAVTISKLSGDVKLNLEFCNNVRLSLDNNLTSLDLKTSYSTVNLKPLGNLAASYTISTSFGSFKNTSNVKFTSGEDKDEDNRYGPKFDHEYSGKSGGGTVPVKVKSSFSKIIVGEASEEDMKDKGKNKTKDKSRT